MIVFSHGGLNAAPIEAAMYARGRGLKVIAITSGDNYKSAKATHSSGNKPGDLADILIDNCCPQGFECRRFRERKRVSPRTGMPGHPI